MKPRILSFYSYCFAICLVLVNCEKVVNLNLLRNPELESKWQEIRTSGWFYEGVDYHRGVLFNGETIQVSSGVSVLLIICSAYYPIYWDYDTSDIIRNSDFDYLSSNSPIMVKTHRISEDFNNPTSYKFYSYLHLKSLAVLSVTGNYTCRSSADKNIQSSRYVFWQALTKNLVFGESYEKQSYRETICTQNWCLGKPSKTVMADSKNETIILPCAVTNPSTVVTLYKLDTTSMSTGTLIFDEIKPGNFNGSINFDAKLGFLLKVKEVNSPYGLWKCIVKSSSQYTRSDEGLVLNATAEIRSDWPFENFTKIGKARYFYDRNSSRITCCSDGTRPPKIYASDCTTKYDCARIRKQLQNFEHFDRNDLRSGNCQSSSLKIGKAIGVFRCFGEGIDLVQEYFIPPKTSPAMPEDYEYDYDDVEDTKTRQQQTGVNQTDIYFEEQISKLTKSHLIGFSSSTLTGIVKGNIFHVFANTSTILQCHPSVYLFAYGVRWSLVYKNKTEKVMPVANFIILSTFLELDNANKFFLNITSDMSAIICHAPLYNSTDWVNKTLILNVTDPVPPTIIGPTHEILNWKRGDIGKRLTCEATGNPKYTYYTWMDPWSEREVYYRYTLYSWSSIISNRVYIGLYGSLGPSTLTFERVLAPMAGNYTCKATTSTGVAYKTFFVNLTELDSANVVITIPTSTTESYSLGHHHHKGLDDSSENYDNDENEDDESIALENPENHSSNSALVISLAVVSVALVVCGIGAGYLVVKNLKQRKALGEDSNGDVDNVSYLNLTRSVNNAITNLEDLS